VVLVWDVSSVMTAFSSICWLESPGPRVGRFRDDGVDRRRRRHDRSSILMGGRSSSKSDEDAYTRPEAVELRGDRGGRRQTGGRPRRWTNS
jgi:hypothetical protein